MNGSELFRFRIDEFESLRIGRINFSTRLKHKQLWSLNKAILGVDYEDYLDSVIDYVKANNEVAKQHAAHEVLDYVKEALLKHAKNNREGTDMMFTANIFDPMTLETDFIHPWSNLHQFLPDQKHMLQLLGADLESQTLVKFMDDQLLKSRKIIAEEKLPDDHEIFIMKDSAYKAFDYLRIGRCG